MDGFRRGRGRSKKYWTEVIRHDMEQLQLKEDMTLDRKVETVAQFGVIFLLFALGLEFSTGKLRIVRAVAVLGGLLQIFLFMCLSGITASLCGGEASEGVFVGVFLSMSSTAVLKFLMERNSVNTLYGQVTIGTLILQDCTVGLLFALLPILGGTSGALQGMFSMAKLRDYDIYGGYLKIMVPSKVAFKLSLNFYLV
ncbi:hypothetical protein FXO37_08742 [Capsicum annuum]|nr:hypothetical protein FXO37_08742 [Capsicum annuum]